MSDVNPRVPESAGSRGIATALLVTFLGLAGVPTHAAVFCVHDRDSLGQAIATAVGNGVNDEIRLRSGGYFANATRLVSATLTGAQSLTLSGGWSGANGQCTVRVDDPGATRLVAGSSTDVIVEFNVDAGASGTLRIENVDITAATIPAPASARCLHVRAIAPVSNLDVTIDRTLIRSCRGHGGGLPWGPVRIDTVSGVVRFRGNRVELHESAMPTVTLSSYDGSVYAVNNTLYSNEVTGTGNAAVLAIWASSGSTHALTNNVFVDNLAPFDISVPASATTSLVRNHYGTLTGFPGGLVSGNTGGDPGLVPGTVRPRADSVLRNSGSNLPTGGLPGLDFAGVSRSHEGLVDRGAYEYVSPTLFADGFE